jgi:hypothetical protein
MFSFFFQSFYKDFKDEIQITKGVVLRGRLITLFWMNKALKIRIDNGTLEV